MLYEEDDDFYAAGACELSEKTKRSIRLRKIKLAFGLLMVISPILVAFIVMSYFLGWYGLIVITGSTVCGLLLAYVVIKGITLILDNK